MPLSSAPPRTRASRPTSRCRVRINMYTHTNQRAHATTQKACQTPNTLMRTPHPQMPKASAVSSSEEAQSPRARESRDVECANDGSKPYFTTPATVHFSFVRPNLPSSCFACLWCHLVRLTHTILLPPSTMITYRHAKLQYHLATSSTQATSTRSSRPRPCCPLPPQQQCPDPNTNYPSDGLAAKAR